MPSTTKGSSLSNLLESTSEEVAYKMVICASGDDKVLLLDAVGGWNQGERGRIVVVVLLLLCSGAKNANVNDSSHRSKSSTYRTCTHEIEKTLFMFSFGFLVASWSHSLDRMPHGGLSFELA